MYLFARILCLVSIATLFLGAAINSEIVSIAGIAGIFFGGIVFVVADKREHHKDRE